MKAKVHVTRMNTHLVVRFDDVATTVAWGLRLRSLAPSLSKEKRCSCSCQNDKRVRERACSPYKEREMELTRHGLCPSRKGVQEIWWEMP